MPTEDRLPSGLTLAESDMFRVAMDRLGGIRPVIREGNLRVSVADPSRAFTYEQNHRWAVYDRPRGLMITLPVPLRLMNVNASAANPHVGRIQDYMLPSEGNVYDSVFVSRVLLDFDDDKLNISSEPANSAAYIDTIAMVCQVFQLMEAENAAAVQKDVLEAAREYMKRELCKHADLMPLGHLLLYLSFPVLLETNSWAAVANTMGNNRWGENSAKLLCSMPRLGFSELFKEYVGTKSPTLMRLVGAKFVQGADYCKLQFDPGVVESQVALVTQRYQGRVIREAKDHIITVGNKVVLPQLLWFTKLLVELLPIDYARMILEKFGEKQVHEVRDAYQNMYGYQRGIKDYENLVAFMSQFSDKVKMALLSEPQKFREYLDVQKQLADYATVDKIPEKLRPLYPDGLQPPKKWKTFKEYHDKVSKAYNEIKAEADNKAIEQVYEKLPHRHLDGVQIDDLTMKLAKQTKDLVEWGRDLKICIASYADRAVSGSSILVGFFRDGKITYAMELPPKAEPVGDVESQDNVFGIRFKTGIRQLVQYNNRPVQNPDLTKIVKRLDEWHKEYG